MEVPATKRHVILGNGGAALSAIQAIRSITNQDNILVISKDNSPAYSPVLTTYYLAGSIPYRQIFICDWEFYAQNKVKLMMGRKAIGVDPGQRKVYLEDNNEVDYDDLLVATGSTPMLPTIPGICQPGIFTLQSAEDARKIREWFKKREKAVIIGAGLKGIQITDALIAKGNKVALVERLDWLLPMAIDRQASEMLQRHLQEVGVEYYLGDEVLEIRKQQRGKVLSLASGKELETDGVIIAGGVRCNMDLLEESGVAMLKGILVDEYCRTNVEDIYAAGDVAESIDSVTGKPELNATWPNAIEQGRTAGLNMVGKKVTCLRGVRYNVSTISGIPCASIGLMTATQDFEQIVFKSGPNYRKLVFRDGYIIGGVLVGDINDAGIILNMVENRVLCPPFVREKLKEGIALQTLAGFLSRSLAF